MYLRVLRGRGGPARPHDETASQQAAASPTPRVEPASALNWALPRLYLDAGMGKQGFHLVVLWKNMNTGTAPRGKTR
jgi:hypothetical protein